MSRHVMLWCGMCIAVIACSGVLWCIHYNRQHYAPDQHSVLKPQGQLGAGKEECPDMIAAFAESYRRFPCPDDEELSRFVRYCLEVRVKRSWIVRTLGDGVKILDSAHSVHSDGMEDGRRLTYPLGDYGLLWFRFDDRERLQSVNALGSTFQEMRLGERGTIEVVESR